MGFFIGLVIGGFLGWFFQSNFVIRKRDFEQKQVGDLHIQLLRIQEMIRDIRGG